MSEEEKKKGWHDREIVFPTKAAIQETSHKIISNAKLIAFVLTIRIIVGYALQLDFIYQATPGHLRWLRYEQQQEKNPAK